LDRDICITSRKDRNLELSKETEVKIHGEREKIEKQEVDIKYLGNGGGEIKRHEKSPNPGKEKKVG